MLASQPCVVGELMPQQTCPKCGHVFGEHWTDYLKKQPGHHVHFFSNHGTQAVPRIIRSRLHYRIGMEPSVIRASLMLVELDHRSDPFFRWCDVASGTLDEVIKYM